MLIHYFALDANKHDEILATTFFTSRPVLVDSIALSYHKVGKITVELDYVYLDGKRIGRVLTEPLLDRVEHL